MCFMVFQTIKCYKVLFLNKYNTFIYNTRGESSSTVNHLYLQFLCNALYNYPSCRIVIFPSCIKCKWSKYLSGYLKHNKKILKITIYFPSSDYMFSFKLLLFNFQLLWTMGMDSTNLHFGSWCKYYTIERDVYSFNYGTIAW